MAQIASPPLNELVVVYRTWHLGEGSANSPGGPPAETPLCCANAFSVIASPSITSSMCTITCRGCSAVCRALGVGGWGGGVVAACPAAVPVMTSLSSTCPPARLNTTRLHLQRFPLHFHLSGDFAREAERSWDSGLHIASRKRAARLAR